MAAAEPVRFFMGAELERVEELGKDLDAAASESFDFITVPLRDKENAGETDDDAYTDWLGSEMLLSTGAWCKCVVGKATAGAAFDSPDPAERREANAAFEREVDWALHLGLPAVLVDLPHTGPVRGLARAISAALRRSAVVIWLRVPLVLPAPSAAAAPSTAPSAEAATEDGGAAAPAGTPTAAHHDVASGPRGEVERESDGGAWARWARVRAMAGAHPRLHVALEHRGAVPGPAALRRWLAEPLASFVFHTSAFLTNESGFPVLPRAFQPYAMRLFDFDVQFALRGTPRHAGTSRVPYLQYLAHLARSRPSPTPQEAFERPFFDFVQVPLQPLADNLESGVYETFEKDPVKYRAYEDAVYAALRDRRVSRGDRAVRVAVVGAGRGPLVAAVLRASERARCPVDALAVEKNPNAVRTLRARAAGEWEGRVAVVATDMRVWAPERPVDILVSELLGSFGDNELSPECLDGAQRHLAPDGFSIPHKYTSFAAPCMTSTLWNKAAAFESVKGFETPYIVRMHRFALLDGTQPVFTFEHPAPAPIPDNSRRGSLRFTARADGVVHGVAGYFDMALYGGTTLSIEPSTVSEGMFSWFPIFFPIQTPLHVSAGDSIDVDFWRCVEAGRVWYEWTVATPHAQTALHNPCGRSYAIGQ